MLPRFHIDRKSPVELAAIKVIEVLKLSANQKCEYSSLRTRSKIKAKPFKHIFAEFTKNFRVYEQDCEEKPNKKIRYVKLIKSLDDDEEMSDDENDDDDDEKQLSINNCSKQVRLFSPNNILINRPLLVQSYNILNSFSIINGVSLKEFQHELFVPRLDARMLIRMLERLDEVTKNIASEW